MILSLVFSDEFSPLILTTTLGGSIIPTSLSRTLRLRELSGLLGLTSQPGKTARLLEIVRKGSCTSCQRPGLLTVQFFTRSIKSNMNILSLASVMFILSGKAGQDTKGVSTGFLLRSPLGITMWAGKLSGRSWSGEESAGNPHSRMSDGPQRASNLPKGRRCAQVALTASQRARFLSRS